ncbi:3x protein [Ferret coronavirus]|uniref:3x protein n=1 Tax=Ferret coronavirus TaxID=1264898 RepID=A0A1B4X979_9ALPC|nr:3x protein [Ferret coronavirus]
MSSSLITIFSGKIWFSLPRSFKDWIVSKVRFKAPVGGKVKPDYRRRALLNSHNNYVNSKFGSSVSVFKFLRVRR